MLFRSTIYGKRIQVLIDELQPRAELIAEHEKKEKMLNEIRAKAPSAVAVEGSDLSKAQEYVLKVRGTNAESADAKTSFRVGWDNNVLIFDILCKDKNVKNLPVSGDVFSGDFVAITLQTQQHSYYILEINPDGVIVDGDPAKTWKSLAEVKPEKGEDYWRLIVKIPVVGADEAASDPLHRVAGSKPLPDSPWFFNVGRKRLGNGTDVKDEVQLFSMSERIAWHSTEYFGRLEIK